MGTIPYEPNNLDDFLDNDVDDVLDDNVDNVGPSSKNVDNVGQSNKNVDNVGQSSKNMNNVGQSNKNVDNVGNVKASLAQSVVKLGITKEAVKVREVQMLDLSILLNLQRSMSRNLQVVLSLHQIQLLVLKEQLIWFTKKDD
ncbi:hypothetical protein Tco_1099125 [Tanacetum coccineum]